MSQDRTALIHRTLRNLGCLPQGQSPSAEEYQSIDDLIDPMLANLVERNIMMRGVDADYLEDEFFLPLAHVLAAVAAPEFGQAQDQAIWALKERAEIDLKMQNAIHWWRLNKEFQMTQYQKPATQYVTVAASQTTAPVGVVGCYLESVTIIPATTASGAVTILDGSTAIATIPAAAALGQSAPYNIRLGIRATSPTTGFKITTGASVTCLAVGRFS